MIEAFKKIWYIGAITFAEMVGCSIYFIVSFMPLYALQAIVDMFVVHDQINAAIYLALLATVGPFCLGTAIQWSGIVGKIKNHLTETDTLVTD
ncbi:MAG: hypothetical protein NE334_19150 [Lentisphaeraceae bacterium]|nr:hypothetical protein [Lentisphaeraceae bacterium]